MEKWKGESVKARQAEQSFDLSGLVGCQSRDAAAFCLVPEDAHLVWLVLGIPELYALRNVVIVRQDGNFGQAGCPTGRCQNSWRVLGFILVIEAVPMLFSMV